MLTAVRSIDMNTGSMLIQVGTSFCTRKKGQRVKNAVFKCSCGNSDVFMVGNVVSGHTKSCGCLVKQTMIALKTTHGKSSSPEYRSWERGIVVCDRWLMFENFLEDMGERPSLQYSIERIDVNGNYTPENCKWATHSEQCRNRRNNRIVEVNGVSLCVAAWAEKFGIQASTITMRLLSGWNAIDAVNTAVGQRRQEREHDE
jgi:hypothetical protein